MSPTPLKQREFFKKIEPTAHLGALLALVTGKMTQVPKDSDEYAELNNLHNKINKLMSDSSPEAQEKREATADIYKNLKDKGITEELPEGTIKLMNNIFGRLP